MSRIPKDYIEGGAYYITSRGDHDERIFMDKKDYLAYLSYLSKYKKQYGFKVFAFMLMPNHLHLLIELAKGSTVSKIMHDINSNYTKFFNAGHNRKGHLFQERPKIVLFEKAAYLFGLMAYIHLNPVKLRTVNDAASYEYSSYRFYSGTASAVEQAQIDLSQELAEAQAGYIKYFKSVKQDDMKALAECLYKEAVMGSQNFKDNVRQQEEKREKGLSKAKGPGKRFMLTAASAIIILIACTLYLYANSVNLRGLFNKELVIRDLELNAKLAEERARIYKDLDEKYRADMISYKAMAKRIETEKGRLKELEDKAR